MARRIIATAEVQVAAEVGQAEAGLQGLTESFRQVGRYGEQAAEQVEAAFFQGARSIQGGYERIIKSNDDLLAKMRTVDGRARLMADSFDEVANSIQKSEKTTLDEKAREMLRLFKQVAASAEAVDRGLHNAGATAKMLAAQAKQIADETKQAELRAERMGQAFRDVGRDIDLALNGGLEGLQDDIRDTIRHLEDMGGEFRDVGLIGERSLAKLNGELAESDGDVDRVTSALFRLERQLRDVQTTGDRALEGLEGDARDATQALNRMDAAAERVDRSIDSIGGISRRTSGDLRGLITLMGAGGFGYAAYEAGRFGLDMTLQLEKAEAMFLGLTGSIGGANDMLERMVTFAQNTPYNLGQVTESAAQLLAVGDGFGVTTQNIEEYMTSFGNAITMTGGGDENFTRLVRVFGQMSSSGKVLGQDMNQLAQNLPGYDVWQALADGAGESVGELRRLQNIGQLDELLTGNEAVQILIEGMNEIPGAAGAMERRMDTLGGALEKFKEVAQLAVSDGMAPFNETAQDALSDPAIMAGVEGLANSFGDLLSSGLQAVAPELDDLAAAGADLFEATKSLAPTFATLADALGDTIAFVAPMVELVGELASVLLEANDGGGKMAASFAMFAAGGPVGIAGGIMLGVSGAIDKFAAASENAANTARLLAAGQRDINDAMAEGEERTLSEAQRQAVASAEDLIALHPALVLGMERYGVSVRDLTDGMFALADGTGETTPAFDAMVAGMGEMDIAIVGSASTMTESFERIQKELEEGTESAIRETSDQTRAFALADIEQIASDAERTEALAAQAAARAEFMQLETDERQRAYERSMEIDEGWGELDAERTETMRDLLEEQVSAFQDWEEGINSSTDNAAVSLSGLASDFENNVDSMIAALNENSSSVVDWKDNIVTAASLLVNEFGVSEEAAQEFMGTLGGIGVEFAPAIAAMIEDGAQLKEFFDANAMNAAAMETDMTEAFQEATGSVPTLVEALADGTADIDDVLAALPEAMEAAGLDMEDVAAAIDLSAEMGTVGTNAVDGLVASLETGLSRVTAAANNLGAAVSEGTRVPLQIRSPSRVMMRLGEFAVEGLIVGVQNMSDRAYAEAVNVASLMSGGIAHHFRNADDPQEAAQDFAEDVAETIVSELLAEREAVADAAQTLAEAAADRLAEAWDQVKDRFLGRDIQEAVAEARAELAAAEAELGSAQSLAGSAGSAALAQANQRVAAAEAALQRAEQADAAADILADQAVTAFERAAEDQANALAATQAAEVAAAEARVAAATRNLDPVARRAAEAALEATRERHDAELTALDRRREDELALFQLRLDNENLIREEAISAQREQLTAFENAADDVADSIADAISNIPGLGDDIADARANLQEAMLDQFERMLESGDSGARAVGLAGGLTAAEVDGLISAAAEAQRTATGASYAESQIDAMLEVLSQGLYTMGSNGGLSVASGLSNDAQSLALAMRNSIQSSVNWAMADLIENVTSGPRVPSTSGLDSQAASSSGSSTFSGPLVSMPGAVIQNATDADLVAQRTVEALSATGMSF